MNNPIKSIFMSVVSVQLLLFMVFVLVNYPDLDDIEIYLDFGGGLELDFTIDLLDFEITVVAILGVLILLGISIIGSSIIDEGYKMIRLAVQSISIYLILAPSTLYYISLISTLSGYINLGIGLIYILHVIFSIGIDNGSE